MSVIYEKRIWHLQDQIDALVECNHKLLDLIKELEDRVLVLEFGDEDES